MALVYILAQSPWGPVQLRTAADTGEVLRVCSERGSPPAEMIDVGERDPAEVVKLAVRTMQPTSGGWYADGVARTSNLAKEAISAVPSRVVAEETARATPGSTVSHGGPMVSDGEARPEFLEATRAGMREATAPAMTNDDMRARVRRRPGAEVDAREIRAKLGMSQPEFARAFGLKVATVRDWDQGRTSPDGAARSLLLLIEHRPSMVKEVLGRYGVSAVGD